MCCSCVFYFFFFFKQKTAYEMRISDWSSDVCSSDLTARSAARVRCVPDRPRPAATGAHRRRPEPGTRLAVRRQSSTPRTGCPRLRPRSEEHTSELQSLMRISYAVFCLKKKKKQHTNYSQKINNNNTTVQIKTY